MEDQAGVSVKDVLESILGFSNKLVDVLVMIRDETGQIGFTTNLSGFEESMSFIDRVKFKAMQHDASLTQYNPGEGDNNGPDSA